MKRVRLLLSCITSTLLILALSSAALPREVRDEPLVTIAGVPPSANLVGLVNQSGLNPDILVYFSFDAAAQVLGFTPVMGLEPDEKLGGIDFDSATAKLIGITNFGNIVTVDQQTGVATTLARISASLAKGKLALDFDPATRVLRITNENGLFIEINLSRVPVIVNVDTPPSYESNDSNAGKTPNIAGLANNQTPLANGGNKPEIFALDSDQDALAVIEGFNMRTLGSLGVNTTSAVGFSAVPGSPFAFASLLLEGETKSRLFQVSLVNGLAVEIGSLPIGPLSGLAVLLNNNNMDMMIACRVTPSEDTNPVGTSHTIKVTATKDGVPVENAFVLVGILVGPNAGTNGRGRTKDKPDNEEKDPEFDFTYQSNGRVGIDLIMVGVVVDGQITFCKAIKRWVKDPDDGSELPDEGELLLITEVLVSKKAVTVKGCCFQAGDLIFINDEKQKTKSDSARPRTVVTAKKGRKKLRSCQNRSRNRVFVRRARAGQRVQDTEAFDTCP
jgi:hypothetical protein